MAWMGSVGAWVALVKFWRGWRGFITIGLGQKTGVGDVGGVGGVGP